MTDVVIADSLTFSLARSVLLNGPGESETERLACRVAQHPQRQMFLICAAPGLLKRFDVWISDEGMVAHAAVDSVDLNSPGLVASSAMRDIALATLMVDGVGGLACTPASEARTFASVGQLTAAVVDSGEAGDRALLVGSKARGDDHPQYLVVADLGGGCFATGVDLEAEFHLVPSTAPVLWAAISRLCG